MGGDFNVVRFPSEKLGGGRVTSSMRGFDAFIQDCGLKDPPLSNAKFTWSVNRSHTVSSHLNRFLFTNEWEDVFLDLVQEICFRLVSDHFPVILEPSKIKWGPTPFRFENMWLSHSAFIPFVKEVWDNAEVQGWEGFKFMRKLKSLKDKLKVWNREVFGDIQIKKDEILKEIKTLDRLDMEGLISSEDRKKKVSLLNDFEELLLKEKLVGDKRPRFNGPRKGM